MTGFDSKRKMALAKLPDDDDTQVYEESDTLLIAYQSGFADGKAAQRKWAGLTDEEITEIYEMGLGVRASIETALDKIEERNT